MLQVDIHMNGEHVEQYQFPDIPMSEYMTQNVTPPSRVVETPLPGGDYSFRLEELAYTRSGDKGNSANIGNQLTVFTNCQDRGNSWSQFIYWYKRCPVQTNYQDRVEFMIAVIETALKLFFCSFMSYVHLFQRKIISLKCYMFNA